jgi:regulator of sirC expression with transglutaminase-like and TPR domain
MAGSLQFEAPTALDYFASLVADDASLPLLEAAVALAQDDDAGLDVQGVLAQIDALAERLTRRIPPDAPALQRLRLLNRYFFHELGFRGNVNNYYDRGNSLVPRVLATRRGIPITLAVLYIEMAKQAGLAAQGVSFPGHFLVKVSMPRGEVVIDPFSGQSLSREDLEERLAPYRQTSAMPDEDPVPLSLYLQGAAPREVIARMLRNLKAIHRGACDWQRLAAVQQRLVILLPEDWEERRDRALVLAELGCHKLAAEELAVYLHQRPQAADAPLLRTHLTAWRGLH